MSNRTTEAPARTPGEDSPASASPRRIAKTPPREMFRLTTDQWTKPFWDATAEHRLVAPRCRCCGTFRMPPSPFCAKCRTQEIDWVELSGRGIVYSFSIVEQANIPAFQDHLPYMPAVIELPDAGGVRLISNIVDVPVEDVRIGAAVRVVWDDHAPGVSLPRFTLTGD